MFHDNYKIYQIDFNKYDVEIEFWNEYTDKKDNTTISSLSEEQLEKLVDFLYALGFDDNTPEEGEI